MQYAGYAMDWFCNVMALNSLMQVLFGNGFEWFCNDMVV